MTPATTSYLGTPSVPFAALGHYDTFTFALGSDPTVYTKLSPLTFTAPGLGLKGLSKVKTTLVTPVKTSGLYWN